MTVADRRSAGKPRHPNLTSQYRGSFRTGTMAAFAALAVVAWVGTVIWANDMGNMPGTMGLGLGSFVLMWGLMMSAMMLPSVAPMGFLYSRTITHRRRWRLTQFAAGYVVAWTLTGVGAFALAWIAGELASSRPTAARLVAVGVFALVGLYQLTPLKYRCLDHCRSPLGHMMHYASFRGPLRHLKAGLHHGLFCLGCCWALMVLMVVFGVMNVWAMVGLALVIALEKLWRHGAQLARAAGWASLALAVLVIPFPGIATGLNPDAVMQMDNMEMGS